MIFALRTLAFSTTFLLILSGLSPAQNQPFYFGNDLSYVNQMEDCGADYLYRGESTDPFSIFADQGTNLVRARLWIDPSWWQEPLNQPDGVKPYYNDLEDVIKTFRRAKDYGMEVMLDLHYSDIWADPGRQLVPRIWKNIADDTEALADSVYDYTVRVLNRLDDEGLMPEFVKVGNENNAGIMLHLPSSYSADPNEFEPDVWVANSGDFERNAALFNAGIKAVRDVGSDASIDPKIALHWSNLNGVQGWYGDMISAGVTDFDIIGFTYYYAWHGGSIGQLESVVSSLVDDYPDYDVMAVETGYLWSQDYGGIINTPDPEYLPVIPEKQLEYMVDYTRAVMRAGGNGVIFWEPAWVDTPCRTPWITGSSHTHVAFFHPDDLNFMENGGGKWTNGRFYEDPHWPKATFRVGMSGVEVAEEGVYITGSFTEEDGDWQLIPMADEGNGIYSWFTYLPEADTGAWYFVNGNDWDARETVPAECADWWDSDRGYLIPDVEEVTFEYKWGTCDSIELPTATDQPDEVPEMVVLRQNYPNPFNPATQITYEISEANHVTLRVYNMVGQKVETLADTHHTPGIYRTEFDGAHLSSGIYMYILQVGDVAYTRTMTLIK